MECDATTKETSDSNVPSCESCRRRKLKCARQQPSCSNCQRFDVACVYDFEKKKPGFKVGVVESLSKRLDVVEKALSFSQNKEQSLPTASPTEPHANGPPSSDSSQQLVAPFIGVLTSLTKELHDLSATISSHHKHQREVHEKPFSGVASLKRKPSESDHQTVREKVSIGPPRSSTNHSGITTHRDDIENLVEDIVDAYFRFVHPWISIVHEPSFRNDICDIAASARLRPVLQAMTVVALRFVKKDDKPLCHDSVEDQVAKARHEVLLGMFDDIGAEHIQAKLILVYSNIADGNVIAAFSLLGVAWTHIERLELHLENPSRGASGGIFGPSYKPPASADWIEREEWRRIFWNAFMLDRLCAALLGHKPTLLGAFPSRRLPVCSSFWYTNQPRLTPYLHLSDPSKTGLHCPVDIRDSTSDSYITEDTTTSPVEQSSATSGVGALAFYVTTMESLSLVMSHFLALNVNFNSNSDVSRWLTRFKELDMHLVRWKSQLPQQWADSGVSRRVMPGVMDPAMTAANATHNTCLILLHERIAYPDAKLSWVQLPSLSSAETCESAAIEICTIIKKILQQRSSQYPLAPQLGLCAFVSARSLLLHWRYYAKPLAPEFWLLVQSLEDMTRRWQPTPKLNNLGRKSVFAQLAERLQIIYRRCELEPSYLIDLTEPLYESAAKNYEASTRHWVPRDGMAAYLERNKRDLEDTVAQDLSRLTTIIGNDMPPQAVDTIIAQHGGLDPKNPDIIAPPASHWGITDNMETFARGLNNDDLLAISESLMGQDFTSMDRIVTLDDMMLGTFPETPMTWDFS
ncbi:fungal-specific transcription factor domain-containing protein [Pyrenochaeta sp. MPI-SDFR-AT-0127]|nr:fungal-specific transcription factor domain-containing protein [Pyrenochaeta sp. MPI-SDFR-AT-0127]